MHTERRLYLAVGLGSGLGATTRYLISAASVGLMWPALPWGVLIVNVVGSFLMGLYATLTAPGGRLPASPFIQHFVLTGFCGGFTTFSIFSLEAMHLVEQSAFVLALIYIVTSVLLWILAALLGFRIGVRFNLKRQ